MAQFLTKLRLETADNIDNGKWIVVEPLIYKSDIANMTIKVPRGFPTDLASVPRVLGLYELVGNTSCSAACIHDFLYTSHILSRRMADDVLKEASVVTLVPAWRREIIWVGVRTFGWKYW